MMINITVIVIAYLLGSLSSAIIVCRLLGLDDPREQGSGNPGATNVMRIGGKKAALITLLGDLLKGVLAVLLALTLGATELAIAGAGCAAFLGHLYPLFFAFRGGKGVATAFGVLIALAPLVALAALIIWLIIAATTRLSSLAALLTAVACPLMLWYLYAPQLAYPGASALMGILLIWRHRSNIQRLLAGTEPKIGQR